MIETIRLRARQVLGVFVFLKAVDSHVIHTHYSFSRPYGSQLRFCSSCLNMATGNVSWRLQLQKQEAYRKRSYDVASSASSSAREDHTA